MAKSLKTILRTFDKTVSDIDTLISNNIKSINAKEIWRDTVQREIEDLDQENKYAQAVKSKIENLISGN